MWEKKTESAENSIRNKSRTRSAASARGASVIGGRRAEKGPANNSSWRLASRNRPRRAENDRIDWQPRPWAGRRLSSSENCSDSVKYDTAAVVDVVESFVVCKRNHGTDKTFVVITPNLLSRWPRGKGTEKTNLIKNYGLCYQRDRVSRRSHKPDFLNFKN